MSTIIIITPPPPPPPDDQERSSGSTTPRVMAEVYSLDNAMDCYALIDRLRSRLRELTGRDDDGA